jgi:hypothetical protein
MMNSSATSKEVRVGFGRQNAESFAKWIRSVCCFVLFITSACAAENAITGEVVDRSGRPVPHALVTLTHRDGHTSSNGTEHVYIQTGQAGSDGRFSILTTEKVGELAIGAESPDLKRHGALRHIQNKGNLIVVQ